MKPSLLGHLCFVNAKTFTEVHRIYTPSLPGEEFQEAQWKNRLMPSGGEKKTRTHWEKNRNWFNSVTAQVWYHPGQTARSEWSFVRNKRRLHASARLSRGPGGSDTSSFSFFFFSTQRFRHLLKFARKYELCRRTVLHKHTIGHSAENSTLWIHWLK